MKKKKKKKSKRKTGEEAPCVRKKKKKEWNTTKGLNGKSLGALSRRVCAACVALNIVVFVYRALTVMQRAQYYSNKAREREKQRERKRETERERERHWRRWRKKSQHGQGGTTTLPPDKTEFSRPSPPPRPSTPPSVSSRLSQKRWRVLDRLTSPRSPPGDRERTNTSI